jgi:hypothetical protein
MCELLSSKGATMTKQQFRKYRKMLRENGSYALRWMDDKTS